MPKSVKSLKSALKTSGYVAKPKKRLTWEPTLEHVRKFHDPMVNSSARRANLRINQLNKWIKDTQRRLDRTIQTGIDPQTKQPMVLTQENIKSVKKHIQNAKNEITRLTINIRLAAQYSHHLQFGKKVKKTKNGKPTITAKEAIRRNTRILKGTDGRLYCVTKKRHFNSRPYWILCKKL